MFVSENLSVNEKGNLAIGGMDTVGLAEEFRTPLYVMDEDLIRKNMAMYKSSIDRFYGGKGLVCYASKAFSCKQIYRVAKEEGLGVDVVSAGELYTALSVDSDPSLMCYHGSNKSYDELCYAVNENVGRIVVDSFNELSMLDSIAEKAGKRVKILLRVGPGIDAHTHEFVRTGGNDSKFGFAIETGAAMEAARLAVTKKHLLFAGIHCHIGSQIFELEPFEHAAEVMLGFMADVKRETGHTLLDLNLGGGFGIKYTDEDKPIAYDKYMESVSGVLKRACEKQGMELPFVIIEPGRSIVGSAGITLYTVGNVKDIKGIRRYVSIDGGMTDNPRYALYGSKYDFVIANRAAEAKTDTVAVVGRCCESGDTLAKETQLQACEIGDIMAVLATGAYNYAMSSNYNRVQKPAVVMVRNGKVTIAVKRETLEDTARNDV